jgi:hypothetical protein
VLNGVGSGLASSSVAQHRRLVDTQTKSLVMSSIEGLDGVIDKVWAPHGLFAKYA